MKKGDSINTAIQNSMKHNIEDLLNNRDFHPELNKMDYSLKIFHLIQKLNDKQLLINDIDEEFDLINNRNQEYDNIIKSHEDNIKNDLISKKKVIIII